MTTELDFLCDVVALLHHEARNVRHLIKNNYLGKEPWLQVTALPNNRDEAWHHLAPLVIEAKTAETPERVVAVFEDRFKVSLDELAEMFADSNWRHAKYYGGNAWNTITRLVIALYQALKADDKTTAHEIIGKLKTARHNTGMLSEKLARLNSLKHNAGK